MISEQQVARLAGPVLAAAGFSGNYPLTPLPGGANNRVFRVEAAGSLALLKVYFQHANDPRDRLGAEYSFTRFAWERGIRFVPQPFAADWDKKMGVFEFIEGRKLQSSEVNEVRVRQAIQFYQELRRVRHDPEALALPPASEACFSIADHIQLVERRLHRLSTIKEASPIDREAASLIKQVLLPAWDEVLQNVQQQLAALNLKASTVLNANDRCLSPSDFGYHNALLTPENQIRFIDFEYAGWDDPAKLVCDFFCQPAIGVPLDYFEMFATAVAEPLSDPKQFLGRFRLLLPVYQIKWCSIMLNSFLPVGSARRNFAIEIIDQEAHKASQLRKVEHKLRQGVNLS